MTSTKVTTYNWLCDNDGATATTTRETPPAGWGRYVLNRTSQGGVVQQAFFDLCPVCLPAFEAVVPVEYVNPA